MCVCVCVCVCVCFDSLIPWSDKKLIASFKATSPYSAI